MTGARLVMRGIGKSFGGVPVLRDVGFTLAPGEVVALLGSNGAGKSTLMKILSGNYGMDAGSIEIDGRAVAIGSPAGAIQAGIRMLPQELSIVPDMTVAENIALSNIPAGGRLGWVHAGRMRARARELLDRLGFPDIRPAQLAGTLTPARQRIVEVCRAIHTGASVLVMDEPTAALSAKEAETLFGIIRQLQREQVSVVYISHYLSEVFAIADRIEVLRDGRNAGSFVPAEASAAEVLAAMLGQAVGNLYEGERGAPGEVSLSVEGLTIAGHLENVSFEVRRGEIVGVFGLVGSGIEALGRSLFAGTPRRQAGTVRVGGTPHDHGARASVARGIGFVAGERKKEGIIGDLTVRENLTLPFLDRYRGRGGVMARRREQAHARRWIERLGIRTRGPEQTIRTLSGGNQQKVCMARWLTEGVRLLILEEPTRGVDVGARRDIYRELRLLAAQGYAILMISSDVEEVAGLADRAIVLDRGRVAARFTAGAGSGQLMAAAGGAAIAEGVPA